MVCQLRMMSVAEAEPDSLMDDSVEVVGLRVGVAAGVGEAEAVGLGVGVGVDSVDC